jgi:hypothetical protein
MSSSNATYAPRGDIEPSIPENPLISGSPTTGPETQSIRGGPESAFGGVWREVNVNKVDSGRGWRGDQMRDCGENRTKTDSAKGGSDDETGDRKQAGGANLLPLWARRVATSGNDLRRDVLGRQEKAKYEWP